jgi:hypothetical protein
MGRVSGWHNSPAFEQDGNVNHAVRVRFVAFLTSPKVVLLLARTVTNYTTLSASGQLWQQFQSMDGSVDVVECVQIVAQERLVQEHHRVGTITTRCVIRATNKETRATRARFVGKHTERLHTEKW